MKLCECGNPADSAYGICKHCSSPKPRDIMIFRNCNDGRWYGTDMNEGCMDRVGANDTVGEVLEQIYDKGIAPEDWE